MHSHRVQCYVKRRKLLCCVTILKINLIVDKSIKRAKFIYINTLSEMTIFKNLSFCYVVNNLHETKKCFCVVSGSKTCANKVTISRRDIIKCFINITHKIDISEKQSFTCHTIHHIIVQAIPSYFIQNVA
jgi:hypothetical protein